MLYFVKQVSTEVSKAAFRAVVSDCKACQSIDLLQVHWEVGKLDVRDSRSRVRMHITHYGGPHYLNLIDCNPSRFFI